MAAYFGVSEIGSGRAALRLRLTSHTPTKLGSSAIADHDAPRFPAASCAGAAGARSSAETTAGTNETRRYMDTPICSQKGYHAVLINYTGSSTMNRRQFLKEA